MKQRVFNVFAMIVILLVGVFFSVNAEPTESTGSGWTAAYFNNTTLSGVPVWVETIPGEIDFFWGNASPVPGIVNEDDFSVRFSTVRSFDDRLYGFSVISDDGMRIFIDGVIVYDEFVERPPTGGHFTMIMTAGTHEVIVEYFDAKGGAVAWFMWLQTGTLIVTLDLLDRPPKPHPSWQTLVHVRLTDDSRASLILDEWVPTDETGMLYLTIITGTYRLWVDANTMLASAQMVTLVAGENKFSIGPMRAGDADDNGLVNILDFSILATAFGKASGEVGYTFAVDFNKDDIINISDFALLAASFGQSDDSS